MAYIKINGETINTECINFIKYDDVNYKIMIYTDDIYSLDYVIDSVKTGFDDEKKKIWYERAVKILDDKLNIRDWDNEFEKYYTKNFEQDIITDEEIE